MTAADVAINLLVHPVAPWLVCGCAAVFVGFCVARAVRGWGRA